MQDDSTTRSSRPKHARKSNLYLKLPANCSKTIFHQNFLRDSMDIFHLHAIISWIWLDFSPIFILQCSPGIISGHNQSCLILVVRLTRAAMCWRCSVRCTRRASPWPVPINRCLPVSVKSFIYHQITWSKLTAKGAFLSFAGQIWLFSLTNVHSASLRSNDAHSLRSLLSRLLVQRALWLGACVLYSTGRSHLFPPRALGSHCARVHRRLRKHTQRLTSGQQLSIYFYFY